MVLLRELLDGVDVIQADSLEVLVSDISYYSTEIEPGWAYVACDLPWMNGHEAIPRVIERGARVIVMDRTIDLPAAARDLDLKLVIVRSSLVAYSRMCANLFDNAHRHLSVIGVTGTKGKTTTCHLLESIYRQAGIKAGLMSTIIRKTGQTEAPSSCTTPDPKELHLLLKEMYSGGVSHVIVETSSIGIVEERLNGIKFQGALFTNLGSDHLAYHRGIENYKMAKARLFAGEARPDACAINVDDPFGAYLATIATGEVITYGRNGMIKYDSLAIDQHGIRGNVSGIEVRSKLLGSHNAANILGAVALTRHMGISGDSIAKGVTAMNGVPGRLQRVTNTEGVEIYIDYAHTPESVLTVLRFLNQVYADRKIVAVIGCGGGADRAKRPSIGRIAVDNADLSIFTTDNPRHEDPEEIISDMVRELPHQELILQGRLEIRVDRREAIYSGVERASKGAVLVILGKGHEKTQEIGGEAIYFDDYAVAAEALTLPHGSKEIEE